MSISMSCINGSSPFLSLNSRLKQTQKLKYNNQLSLRSTEPTGLLLQHNQRNIASLRTSAIADSLILGATSSEKSGDIKVFLLTSAGLLFFYWIANFVVPDFISRYLQFDKVNEEQKTEDKR